MTSLTAFLARASSLVLIALVSVVGVTDRVAALTQDAIIESCREPRVLACVQMMVRKLGGPGTKYIGQCRTTTKAPLEACVKDAMTKTRGQPDAAAALPVETADRVAPERALKGGFVVPPRTIADITAILDSEKPDAKKIAERKAKANEEPANDLDKKALAEFYLNRGYARADLGFTLDAISDGQLAVSLGKESHEISFTARAQQFVAYQQWSRGDSNSYRASLEEFVRLANAGSKGLLFGGYRRIGNAEIQIGNISNAEAYLQRSVDLLREAKTSANPKWRKAYAMSGAFWEAEVEISCADILEARGQLMEAEKAFARAESYHDRATEEWYKTATVSPSQVAESQVKWGAANLSYWLSRVKRLQGRLPEAESDARRALLIQLKSQGKYSSVTAGFINGLAIHMTAQGRFVEAEQLVRTSLDVQDTIGIAADSNLRVQTLEQLASTLNYQSKFQASGQIYRDMDVATAGWEQSRKERLAMSGSRVTSLYSAGKFEEGIKLSKQQLDRAISQTGADSSNAAIVRGNLAIGYLRNNQIDDAEREFKTAIPILMKESRAAVADEGGSNVDANTGRLRYIVEAYLAMLARNPGKVAEDVATETFALADAVRGQVVQGALGASSARAGAKDPALAEIVRKEQDLGKRIAAQQAALNNALASDARDDDVIKATNIALATARKELDSTRREINSRFPAYADLVNPKPPSIAQIKGGLKNGEALLSFYFGRQASFVWAVPKEGAPAFARIDASPDELKNKIRKVREALEPNASMISEIPAFDLKLANELYTLLLKPVERGWKQSNSLIVVTNGALGLLPLSLLPTEPAQLDPNETILFESYRGVKWLARTHAVTVIPSSSALLTLRQVPKPRDGRQALLAYGDPIFSVEQAEQARVDPVRVADAAATTRGLPLKRRNAPQLDGVDSAELAQLPRLPDTADELTSIAIALKADPAKSVFLGKDANEASIKAADLSRYKVLAFATHGLVPGELNGLTQPALALSAPQVAGTADGDGLLTMEEILALKLDADWVVLSACNTGAGSGAGAEAASGLGRAFFYAGTRALLVTNWSVHSQSARELVTDLFKRQADDSALTRGEALRRAMMAMVDGAGYKDPSGETEFVYAHPLFWAPYTIIGDTGSL